MQGEILVCEIKIEDIGIEIDYWKHSVSCYVLGDHPPFAVLNGFIQHMWAKIQMPTYVQQEHYNKRQMGLVKNTFQVLNQELINTKGVTSQSRNVGGSNIPIIGNG
ncbi:hypothetical protein H5410_047326 [Solanum commersonii]|uniref:Uncharacterized protein n=1 Tax=Solanum commersonii TaxID=4109 RepID=A0A9J5XHY8_SOLCO|nr:hypothetical protein H5410_047326 [Solanum commersonii]